MLSVYRMIGLRLQQMQLFMMQEEGQDLIEYALVVGLISISAVTGIKGAAVAVSKVISSITATLNAAV